MYVRGLQKIWDSAKLEDSSLRAWTPTMTRANGRQRTIAGGGMWLHWWPALDLPPCLWVMASVNTFIIQPSIDWLIRRWPGFSALMWICCCGQVCRCLFSIMSPWLQLASLKAVNVCILLSLSRHWFWKLAANNLQSFMERFFHDHLYQKLYWSQEKSYLALPCGPVSTSWWIFLRLKLKLCGQDILQIWLDPQTKAS